MYRTIKSFIILFIVLFNCFVEAANNKQIFEPGKTRPKVGLALSGGGALGLAHIGVLKKIDSLDIPVDFITGTSMGGLVGGLYACGYSAKEIENLARKLDWENYFRDRPDKEHLPYFVREDLKKYQFKININKYKPEMPGLINGQKIELLLARLTYKYSSVKDFNELPIPFRCISVDLVDGKEVIHHEGNLARAMRSTMSVPSIFAPVKMGDSLLIDGGLLNNLPVDVVRDMGAEIIIASSVKNPAKTVEELNNPINVIDQSFNIIRNRALRQQINNAELHVNSVINEYKSYNFSQKKTNGIIDRGIEIAEKYEKQFIELKDKYNLNKFDTSNINKTPYIIGKIKITGNLAIPDSLIYKRLPIRIGEIITTKSIEDTKDSLSSTEWFTSFDFSFKSAHENIVNLTIEVNERKKPYIYGIDIKGNKQLPFGFIYRMLGIKPGERLKLNRLENRINYLYGMEYFKNISYDIKKVDFNMIRLTLLVRENTFSRLRMGFRYDNHYGLVANISALQNNFLLPGLKATDEIQFIGLTKIKARIYYPSRTFSQPFYPFIYLNYMDIPRSIYDRTGIKMAAYDQRSFQFGGGAGYVFNNFLNAELSGNREYINIKPEIQLPDTTYYPSWKKEIDKINLTFNYNGLDNSINPTTGLSIKGLLEYSNYLGLLNNDINYYKLLINSDFYYTPFEFLTIKHGAYFIQSNPDMPIYKGEFVGGPDSFIGLKYNQFLVNNFLGLSTFLKFHLPEKFSLKFIANYALDIDHYSIYYERDFDNLDQKYGLGVSVIRELPIGPFEIMYARGPKGFSTKNKHQSIIYIKAGYEF